MDSHLQALIEIKAELSAMNKLINRLWTIVLILLAASFGLEGYKTANIQQLTTLQESQNDRPIEFDRDR